jgi:hypothetical protein
VFTLGSQSVLGELERVLVEYVVVTETVASGFLSDQL